VPFSQTLVGVIIFLDRSSLVKLANAAALYGISVSWSVCLSAAHWYCV